MSNHSQLTSWQRILWVRFGHPLWFLNPSLAAPGNHIHLHPVPLTSFKALAHPSVQANPLPQHSLESCLLISIKALILIHYKNQWPCGWWHSSISGHIVGSMIPLVPAWLVARFHQCLCGWWHGSTSGHVAGGMFPPVATAGSTVPPVTTWLVAQFHQWLSSWWHGSTSDHVACGTVPPMATCFVAQFHLWSCGWWHGSTSDCMAGRMVPPTPTYL